MAARGSTISVTTLAIMTVAAVVSLRGLPMMGKEGLQMFFYIGFAGLLFLLPAALVAAELGSAFGDKKGGVYTWVKAAFGPVWGFTAIWLQWIQNVVWYPTVLAFAAAALAYLVDRPDLAASGVYTGIVTIVFYWLATFVTLSGTSFASRITSLGTLLGTVLPGAIIILLGLMWLIAGNPLHFLEPSAEIAAAERAAGEAPHARLFPHITGLGSLAFLGGIVLLFAGVEVHAVHANELATPRRDFPRAIFLAIVIILVLFSLGSLSLAAMIPADKIDLNQGLMQAFAVALDHFGLGWLLPVTGLLVAFGALAGVMSWIAGPSRGLLQTAEDGEIPPVLARTNKNGMQINILIIQGLIVTALASLYFLIDNVSVAFFLLSAMTITLYLVMYMLMYAAAIRLRYTQPELARAYQVPGGMTGMWLVAGIGLLGVLFAFVVAFFPPSQLPVGNPALYMALVSGGFVLFVGLPLIIQRFKKPEWRVKAATS